MMTVGEGGHGNVREGGGVDDGGGVVDWGSVNHGGWVVARGLVDDRVETEKSYYHYNDARLKYKVMIA